MALVGELEDERASRAQDPRELAEDLAGIGEVVDDPNADDGVERAVLEGQAMGVAGDEPEARIDAESLGGGLEQRRGRVEERDRAEAVVLVGQPPEPGSDLDEPIALCREQRPERDPVAAVLIVAVGPEDVAIGEVVLGHRPAGRRGPSGGRIGGGRGGLWLALLDHRESVPARRGRPSGGAVAFRRRGRPRAVPSVGYRGPPWLAI